MKIPKYILPTIVIAQFFCTSLWFASNGVMQGLIQDFELPRTALGYLTSSVQLGFIIGTLSFSFLSIADRYAPSKIFMISAVIGAITNIGISISSNTIETLIVLRALTGFFLAGIYPIGMKIAADYYEKGLGKSLSFLVGALVLGTAFPHLMKGLLHDISWQIVLYSTSVLAITGGLLMFFYSA